MDTISSIPVVLSSTTNIPHDDATSQNDSNKPQKPLIDSCSTFKSWNLSPQTIKTLKYGAIGCATGGLLWMILYVSGTCRGSAAALATTMIPAFTIAGIGVSFCNKCQKDVNTALIPDVSQDVTSASTQNTIDRNTNSNTIQSDSTMQLLISKDQEQQQYENTTTIEQFNQKKPQEQFVLLKRIFNDFHSHHSISQKQQQLPSYWEKQTASRKLLENVLSACGMTCQEWQTFYNQLFPLINQYSDFSKSDEDRTVAQQTIRKQLQQEAKKDKNPLRLQFFNAIATQIMMGGQETSDSDIIMNHQDIGDVSQKEFDECHNLDTLAKWNFNDQKKKCNELFIEFRKHRRETRSSLTKDKKSYWNTKIHGLLLEEIIQHSLSATTSKDSATRSWRIWNQLHNHYFNALETAQQSHQAEKVLLAQTDAKNFLASNFLQETTTQKACFAALSDFISSSNIV